MQPETISRRTTLARLTTASMVAVTPGVTLAGEADPPQRGSSSGRR
jgi:hypothetical protein